MLQRWGAEKITVKNKLKRNNRLREKAVLLSDAICDGAAMCMMIPQASAGFSCIPQTQ